MFSVNARPKENKCDVLLFSQEDDIDGEHIVAFAEEDDPGNVASPLTARPSQAPS